MSESVVFSSERGGYNKEDVLKKVEAYTAVLVMLHDNNMSLMRLNAELERIRSMPLRRLKVGFISTGSGYSVKQTDDYLSQMEDKINRFTYL